MPRFSGVTAAGFSALAVGMARGVLEEWLAYTGPRTSRGVAIGAQQSTHVLAARCAAEIDAAHALYQVTLRGGMRKVEEGGTLSNADRLTGRRNVAFACQLALRAATRLFNAAGGRALYTKGAMQRQYRNLIGAAAHHGVNWESSAADYGGALLEQYGAPRQGPQLIGSSPFDLHDRLEAPQAAFTSACQRYWPAASSRCASEPIQARVRADEYLGDDSQS